MLYTELDFIYTILVDRVQDVKDGSVELDTLPDIIYDDIKTRMGSFLE